MLRCSKALLKCFSIYAVGMVADFESLNAGECSLLGHHPTAIFNGARRGRYGTNWIVQKCNSSTNKGLIPQIAFLGHQIHMQAPQIKLILFRIANRRNRDLIIRPPVKNCSAICEGISEITICLLKENKLS